MPTVAPATPSNFLLQQANAQVFLSWNASTGATSYLVYRSIDNQTFTLLTTVTVPKYLDTVVTVGTQYWYYLIASNGNLSPATATQSIVPTNSGQLTLGQVRLLAQWTADRLNSNFITVPEWNTYINQSYFELYDILVQKYGDDYFVASPYQFQTDGINAFFDLPTDFYKLLGVDLGISPGNNAWVTLRRFNFIARNRYVFPNITANYLGVANMQYRLMDNQLEFIPTPAGNQTVQVWYVPRLTQLLQDTDIMDGISGWTEYVVIDVAIKALRKEESPTEELRADKAALLMRIESAAENRDAGEPCTISDTRRFTDPFGFGSPNGDGPYGGF